MPRCWGNINCLKNPPALLVIAEKTVTLTELQRVERTPDVYYSRGIMSKASGRVAHGKIENCSVVLEVLSEGDSQPRGLSVTSAQSCPLPESFKAHHFHPLRFCFQVSPSKSKLHKFFVNTCRSSWSCWVMCRKEHHRNLASLAWLDPDLIAHFIQSAEVSHLLLGESRPKGKAEGWWGGTDIQKWSFSRAWYSRLSPHPHSSSLGS